jgi:predicted Rdx family selenoprotein
VRLKNKLESSLGMPVRIRTGAPGSFRVLLDGKQIFSLKEAGHLPSEDDILRLIQSAAS